jgi:hypothetical protein
MDPTNPEDSPEQHIPTASVEFQLDEFDLSNDAGTRGLGGAPTDYPIKGVPTISAGRFTDELTRRASPALGEADSLYRTCLQFGVNPAVALGFFARESTFGTDPNHLVLRTRNWGNLAQAKNPARSTGQTVRYDYVVNGEPRHHDFPVYKTWTDGIADFCDSLTDPQGLYWPTNKRTVSTVLPTYAPGNDGNDTARYIKNVVDWTTAWSDQPNGPPAPMPAAPLADLTLDSPVLGAPTGTQAQAVAYILAQQPADWEYKNDTSTIMSYYWHYAPPVGVDPFLAAVQCIQETGSLRSYWAGRPRRNPAGLGVPDQSNHTVGLSFPNWEVAVQAHLGHILNFALPAAAANPTQQGLMTGDPLRGEVGARQGSAHTVRDLSRCWAGNDDYGAQLVALAGQVRNV